ncbi:MAG: 4-alpha-glucanotransferase [Zetaproteobacteria bacterium CG06_land_8_20_14_3_00_59_53]|nr:MAG: 4-alpha-glucanotransferase [Zetaproteobacteria bacterium CG2_30_59_37]PIO89869.1 MAG: 4-alpha-glucanotransferase [Zetaproteobacteria bacterium CG23_combo_of_CG06-09_8_20_14_all_59_86]PIQ64234.1 MAG: 4-alpha-glucanotransferase [Zetaproteobacteria bacterium CG11_big_fil_rev_8_21_14_0_20_59_439]PIU70420.1 MAG: 4-alpha-glucanotransferase [Zetaproteobacteria bacterium CG06_land_8_20_14_3_00_59_53]PIU97456.1 MAG: 4-alpha-glucanotransferase [Zetaproteobacteria bacterium CG03_land_8_20_14_0_80_
MKPWLDRRRAGVLLHITSLPGPQAVGTLGSEAHAFVDSICKGGFSVWQFLPLGPTHGHGSPYESLSTFAGNPDLIDLRACVAEGWLADTAGDKPLLRAGHGFWHAVARDDALAAEVQAFRLANASWLEDYALFTALKQRHNGGPWWQWDTPLARHEAAALSAVAAQCEAAIQQVVFEQFAFDRQWHALKQHAESRGIILFGDLPIYVAHDSVDVWANQSLFTVNEKGLCDDVAGVPPDYFAENGQRWGNPLYRWEAHEASEFDWWLMRIEAQMKRMHLLRIDHFRGLEAFWSIPGDREDGKIGEWIKAPGKQLLQALKDKLGRLPIAAEDLGLITPEVTALLDDFDLPGMKVLQFAFDGSQDNPYLPGNFDANSVIYTGTHDNDTTMGWYAGLGKDEIDRMAEHADLSGDAMPWPLIRVCIESDARLAMIPMQDLLSLGSEARLNTPGTLHGNWQWRMQRNVIQNSIWTKAHSLNLLSGRVV